MNKIITHCLFVIAIIALSQYSFAAKSASKKNLLINELQDIIQPYNTQIIINRQRIHKIAEQYLHDDEISENDFNWLKNIAESYQLTPKQRNDQAFFDALLKRVDVIPNSLIISLAVVNGAWVHQNPAKRLNFLCLNPCSSESNTEQRLHLFFLSVNTQSRYHQFREQRYQLRNQQQTITGRQLADSLLSSPAYLQQRHIIKKLLTTHKWQKMDTL